MPPKNLNFFQAPVSVKNEHEKEVHSVDWSLTRDLQLFISASWDGKIKLWDADRPASLSTFAGHEGMVYSAVWSPLVSGAFASVSQDGKTEDILLSRCKNSNPVRSFCPSASKCLPTFPV